jgi:predicted nuclease of predicted toxin-antitoxin system
MRLSRGASAVNRQSTFFQPMRPRWKEFHDPNVLAFATKENRILVTSDLRTMPRHFGDFLEANGRCAGVFLVKQRAVLADVIEALVLVWAASTADEWNNRIVEIPQS